MLPTKYVVACAASGAAAQSGSSRCMHMPPLAATPSSCGHCPKRAHAVLPARPHIPQGIKGAEVHRGILYGLGEDGRNVMQVLADD